MKGSAIVRCRPLLWAGALSLLLGGTAPALARVEQRAVSLLAPSHPLDPILDLAPPLPPKAQDLDEDIYERDGGALWKHLETGNDEPSNQSRRARELVVFSIATVGNYDYSISWIFRQDGAIEVEAGLSGIMLPKGVSESQVHDANGHLVSRRVVAPHHQHILNFRLDFDVDGTGNSVAEMNTRSMPPGPDNPAGTAMVMEETVLAVDQGFTFVIAMTRPPLL